MGDAALREVLAQSETATHPEFQKKTCPVTDRSEARRLLLAVFSASHPRRHEDRPAIVAAATSRPKGSRTVMHILDSELGKFDSHRCNFGGPIALAQAYSISWSRAQSPV